MGYLAVMTDGPMYRLDTRGMINQIRCTLDPYERNSIFYIEVAYGYGDRVESAELIGKAFKGKIDSRSKNGSGMVLLDIDDLKMNIEAPLTFRFENTDLAESGLRMNDPITFEIRLEIANKGENNEYLRNAFATNIQLIKAEIVSTGEIAALYDDGSGLIRLDPSPSTLSSGTEELRFLGFEKTDLAELGLKECDPVTFERRLLLEGEGEYNEYVREEFATNIRLNNAEIVSTGEIATLDDDGSGWVRLDPSPSTLSSGTEEFLRFEKTDLAELGLKECDPVTFERRLLLENEGEHNEYVREKFATNIRLNNVTS